MGLFKEIKNLDWEEILNFLSGYATATPTKDALKQIVPFHSAEAAIESFTQIDDCRLIINSGVRPFMESLDLFDPWALKLKKHSVLNSMEFRDIRHFCMETIALKETLERYPSQTWLSQNESKLMNAEEPLSAIEHVFAPSGEIRNDASETLYRLFKEKETLARDIHQTLERLVRDHDMAHYLQDKFVTTRDGRWVIPVKGGSQHQVKGMIQAHSQTKQTVFIEPDAVIPMNNRLRQVDWEIEQEIERIITELSQYMWSQYQSFSSSREVLSQMDFKLSQAQFANKLEAQTPQFSENIFDLKDLKHPVLMLTYPEVIPNTVELNQEKSILLLTGPNAGGKTVLLKSLGLAAQMARCGFPICAEKNSQLPFFKKIITSIGDSQSVDEHLSTFAAHLKILDKATHVKGYENLLLVDEICGSTDPEEGSALAKSFIERFADNKIFSVITSHLGALKSGWTKESPVLQGSLQYDEKSGRPTFQFIPGIAGHSMALQTAKRVGVSIEITKRAYELLSPELRAQQLALEDIEKLKQDLVLTQKDYKKRAHEAEQKIKHYENLVKEFEKEKSTLLNKVVVDAKKTIDEKIAHTSVDQVFKKFRNLEQIKNDLPEIVKAQPAPGYPGGVVIEPPKSAEEFIQKFPAGTKVFIPTLNQDGIIQGTPNNKGELQILSNSLRLWVHWKSLKPPEKPTNPTGRIVRTATSFKVGLLPDQDRSIDLRGKLVEDALIDLERELDIATQRNEDRIKIIHGHGTEALKRAVRAYLSRSLYVKKWKAGTPENGGDGITWVELGTDN